jgi:hypothetical protein
VSSAAFSYACPAIAQKGNGRHLLSLTHDDGNLMTLTTPLSKRSKAPYSLKIALAHPKQRIAHIDNCFDTLLYALINLPVLFIHSSCSDPLSEVSVMARKTDFA